MVVLPLRTVLALVVAPQIVCGDGGKLRGGHASVMPRWRHQANSHHGPMPHPQISGLRVAIEEFLKAQYSETSFEPMVFTAAATPPAVAPSATPDVSSWTLANTVNSIPLSAPIAAIRPNNPLGCDQGDAVGLEPFEQWALKDFPLNGSSVWGRLCFDSTQGASKRQSQALFILGLKALSNFNYDFCKYSFSRSIKGDPDFVMAYWGRSMCEAQFLWNAEKPDVAAHFLRTGRAAQTRIGLELSDREERYYSAAEDLTDVKRQRTLCETGAVAKSRPCRLAVFARNSAELFSKYPQDANAGAYVILAKLALGMAVCNSTQPRKCPPADDARDFAEKLIGSPVYRQNPAFLHYSLHAFDYPYEDVYTRGLPFAELYTTTVKHSVHSLHMPSHIFIRSGNFAAAAAADHASIEAADLFAKSGALQYNGGPIGSKNWRPGKDVSGLGFAYNAGNVYHSLEFEEYSALQLCDFERAERLTKRIGVASYQALGAGGKNIGDAWIAATTYLGWQYRMRARLSLQATMGIFIGGMGEVFSGANEAVSIAAGLPQALSWNGSTEYNNVVYAPQSEAGLWNAIALSLTLGDQSVLRSLAVLAKEGNVNFLKSQLAEVATSTQFKTRYPYIDDELPWLSGLCPNHLQDKFGYDACPVAMALHRIGAAIEHYRTADYYYEGNLTMVLRLQVMSAVALAQGNVTAALTFARVAGDVEWVAVDGLLPSSTTLFFIPGTAFYGIIALRLAEVFGDATLLRAAEGAFERCLSPRGRPGTSLCLLGAARAARRLTGSLPGNASIKYYSNLWRNWVGSGTNTPAKKYCAKASLEVETFIRAA